MARSRRRITFGFWLLACGLAAAQQPQEPTFRAGAELVTVDVYPQQNGRIVEGLTPGDFEVLEDGKPQRVENFDFIRVEPVATDAARRDPNSGDEGNRLAADPKNRVFVAFLDDGHVTIPGSAAIRQPLITTLRRLLTPNDLFGVMTSKMRPTDLVFGRSLTAIEEQLSRYWAWGERGRVVPVDAEEVELRARYQYDRCSNERWVDDGAVRRPLADVLIARRREDRALTSLGALIARLGELRQSQTSVLLVTAGWRLFEPDQKLAEQAWDRCMGTDSAPPPIPGVGRVGGTAALGDRSVSDNAAWSQELMRLANLDDARRFRDLVVDAQRRNIAFYPINPEGLEVFDASMAERTRANPRAGANDTIIAQDLGRLRDRTQNLAALAENTGGIAVVNSNDLTGGLERIVADTSAYYLLGYYSQNTRLDGAYRRIQVKLKRPGIAVKARRGYFAPVAADEAAKAARAAAAALAQPVAAALASLSRLRASAELFSYGVIRADALQLVVEIPSARAASGAFTQGADVEAVVAGPGGEPGGVLKGRIEAASRAVLLSGPAPTGSAGPWRVDIKVSAAGERLEDRAEIRAVEAAPLLGEPIVFRAAPGPRSPLRPVADFQFRRTERVHLEWPAGKPLDQRRARLLSRAGQPLAIGVALSEPRAGVLAADVSLAALAPGDYVVELTAGAGADLETKLLAIRIVQ